jgi:hypothetical protein
VDSCCSAERRIRKRRRICIRGRSCGTTATKRCGKIQLQKKNGAPLRPVSFSPRCLSLKNS